MNINKKFFLKVFPHFKKQTLFIIFLSVNLTSSYSEEQDLHPPTLPLPKNPKK